uniref:Uncharacterized protein n=1 Tax=Oryza punctata TaxID=4537 RepID=A0A0E0JM70_ORYPU
MASTPLPRPLHSHPPHFRSPLHPHPPENRVAIISPLPISRHPVLAPPTLPVASPSAGKLGYILDYDTNRNPNGAGLHYTAGKVAARPWRRSLSVPPPQTSCPSFTAADSCGPAPPLLAVLSIAKSPLALDAALAQESPHRPH